MKAKKKKNHQHQTPYVEYNLLTPSLTIVVADIVTINNFISLLSFSNGFISPLSNLGTKK